MRTAWKAIPTLSRTCAHCCSGLRVFGGGSATSAGCAEIVGIRFRGGLLAGGSRIRTIGPSCTTSTRIGLKKHRSFVRKVSRDACARVKCSGGAAILTIEWLDRDHRHVRTLYRNLRVGTLGVRAASESLGKTR